MDAFIYIRFSTPRQENGSSKNRQLDACRAFIKAKGWNEAGIIEDLGRSAWKGNHLTKGNLGKFAKRIFGSEFEPGSSVLVVENLDRLSRQRARITQRWVTEAFEAECEHLRLQLGRLKAAVTADIMGEVFAKLGVE